MFSKCNGTIFFAASLSAFIVPLLCCRPGKEYTARDGHCCPMCHEGTVVTRDCTLQSGTRCGRCGNGTYMNQPNGLNTCFPCTSCETGEGLFVLQLCTTTTDTVCHVLGGFFCKEPHDAGCSLAQKHKRCARGQRIKTPGNSRNDTECESCQPGSFSKDGVNCTVWTTCSETEKQVTEGSSISDVVCGAASRNHFFYVPILLLLVTVVGLMIGVKFESKKSSVSSPGL